MKKLPVVKIALIALALGAWTMPQATAEPRLKGKRGAKQVTTPAGLIVDSEERTVLLTGSHIPQRVRVKSIGTDSVHNVRIFTQREIMSINGGQISGIALDPSITISGH